MNVTGNVNSTKHADGSDFSPQNFLESLNSNFKVTVLSTERHLTEGTDSTHHL